MLNMKKVLFCAIIIMFSVCFLLSCQNNEKVIHLYTALDYEYSKPIIDEFIKKTGIDVKVTYDTEATKTVGLVNRLIAEKENPQCDVFWNNEILRTLHLKNKGVLDKYISSSTAQIPDKYKDPEGYWAGFAARIRVIVSCKSIFEKDPGYKPKSIQDLIKSDYNNRTAIANPFIGTSATHTAALYMIWGKVKTRDFFQQMKINGVKRLPGNSVVRDYAAMREIDWGMTDSDDVVSGLEKNKDIEMIIPDQGENGMGTLLIPNTVSLIKGAPHPEAAKLLIDYLLSEEVEKALAECPSAQIPLHPGIKTSGKLPPIEQIKTMDINYSNLSEKTEEIDAFIKELSQEGF